MFTLQHQDVHENFIFSHETMPFSFDVFYIGLYRPLKGAIFLKCESQKFRRPLVFVDAHFHAHEGTKFVLQREKDLQQILHFIDVCYQTCNWCLLSDLNFRSSESSPDEFQQYFQKYGIIEHPSNDGNTHKIDENHRTKFDAKRKPSRTDRICHNATIDLQIDEYGVLNNSAAPDTAAGAWIDHKPVYEIFRIKHRNITTSTRFLISY
jgi:hypothetical protein